MRVFHMTLLLTYKTITHTYYAEAQKNTAWICVYVVIEFQFFFFRQKRQQKQQDNEACMRTNANERLIKNRQKFIISHIRMLVNKKNEHYNNNWQEAAAANNPQQYPILSNFRGAKNERWRKKAIIEANT